MLEWNRLSENQLTDYVNLNLTLDEQAERVIEIIENVVFTEDVIETERKSTGFSYNWRNMDDDSLIYFILLNITLLDQAKDVYTNNLGLKSLTNDVKDLIDESINEFSLTNTLTLQQLWNILVNHGYEVRSTGQDGLNEWQPYKNTLKNYKIDVELKVDNGIKYLCEEHYNSDEGIFVYNDIEINNEVESAHFLIQHCRIPKLMNFKLSILKLLQIAYNAGQFLAEQYVNNTYPDEIINMYYENNMDKLTTYVKGVSFLVPYIQH